MIKKITIISLLSLTVFGLLVISGANFARAENNQDKSDNFGQMIQGMTPGKMMKTEGDVMRMEDLWSGVKNGGESAAINADGHFRVTGVLVNSVSSSTNTLNVSLFGFSRDVNVAGAKIVGAGKPISIGDIMVGDKLAAKGTWNRTTRVITVEQINDASYNARNNSNINARIAELLKMISQLQERVRSLQGN